MKKTIIALALLSTVIFPAVAQTESGKVPENLIMQARGGVAPVVAGSADISSLPVKAQILIKELFPQSSVVKIENEFAKREYEVKMSDGYEVTFDYDGNWLQIESPDSATLPSSTLSRLVPEAAVLTTIGSDALMRGGATDAVCEINVLPDGYLIEYATGTVGKGRAHINKSDGSILIKDKKAKKGYKAGKERKKGKGGKHAKLRKEAFHGRNANMSRELAELPFTFVQIR